MNTQRYSALDCLRGIALINMIAYHAVWDLVYMFGFDWQWYRSDAAGIWQQGICWTFIFLSGFCQPLGRRKLKRGLTVFGAGLLISIITVIAMPQNKVVFGVLTLLGSCMLLMIPAESLLKRCQPVAGFIICTIFFIFTKNVNEGFLGFANWNILELPKSWYSNYVTTYLGLPMPEFFSTDYFSLFPWVFLFVAGYFLYRLFYQKELLHYLTGIKIAPVEWVGRHSLIIYVVHQPVLYLLFVLLF